MRRPTRRRRRRLVVVFFVRYDRRGSPVCLRTRFITRSDTTASGGSVGRPTFMYPPVCTVPIRVWTDRSSDFGDALVSSTSPPPPSPLPTPTNRSDYPSRPRTDCNGFWGDADIFRPSSPVHGVITAGANRASDHLPRAAAHFYIFIFVFDLRNI